MSTKLILLTSFVLVVGLATEVANADFIFGTPTNLGPTINSSRGDWPPSISADGLTLYFGSYNRPGGCGKWDIWVATRETADAEWGTAHHPDCQKHLFIPPKLAEKIAASKCMFSDWSTLE